MKRLCGFALAALMTLVCAQAFGKDKSENGVYRPTLSTNPKKYLQQFPLSVATQSEVVEYVGAPDKTSTTGGAEYMTYDIASKKHSSGVIEYTFEIRDGKVVNVTYLNAGNFFGMTQRESAKDLQSK